MVVFGAWLALAGAIALLAGLGGARRRRRLRRTGLTAWAMVLPTPSEPEEARARRGSPGVSVQFVLDDGRVIERAHGRPARRSAALRPGERVLVWYDPADPGDVLVYGSDGRWSDRVFLTLGLLLLGAGIVMAVAVG